jgi:hypothetical protein
MQMTRIARIDLSEVDDLDAALKALCDNQHVGGFQLAASFVFEEQLVLIFQRA